MSGQFPERADGVSVDLVRMTDVVKRFTTGGARLTAIGGVSLLLAEGSVVALTGPSGSGKSTLLHLIGAIERPDSGSIFVGGQELTQLSNREIARYRSGVGFVFQRFHLLPALNALDNVVAPVLPYRVPFDRVRRAQDLLDAVGLAGRETALPSQLSGGQQQRVAIARALIAHPRLLLADEPTGNLDSAAGQSVLELLLSLRDNYATTVIIATHDADIAARCDKIIRLRDGQLVDASDPPSNSAPR